MTEPEFFAVYFEAINVAHNNFEFWLSGTFAFILAFHFAGEGVSTFFRRVLMGLYLITAIIFITNWANGGLLAMEMANAIQSNDPDITVRAVGGSIVPQVTGYTMFLGTMAALYFAFKAGKISDSGT